MPYAAIVSLVEYWAKFPPIHETLAAIAMGLGMKTTLSHPVGSSSPEEIAAFTGSWGGATRPISQLPEFVLKGIADFSKN